MSNNMSLIHVYVIIYSHSQPRVGLMNLSLLYPRLNEVERRVYWFHLVRPSVCPSVRLSVCGQNRVRTVSSIIILIGSISYLRILSSNFRRCVTCKVYFLFFFNCLLLTWDPMWPNSMGNHEAAGYPQNAGVLVVLVKSCSS